MSTNTTTEIQSSQKFNYLSVIMPAYNEEKLIYNNALTTSLIVKEFCNNYEILVVDDGSMDHTLKEAKRAQAQDSHIRVISYHPNKGKGNAIKEGTLQANGEHIAFLDSDLDLNPKQLKGFYEKMLAEQCDIVIGSKLHKDSEIDYPYKRKILSFGYYILLRILFKLHTKDTQTGIKLFKASAIKPIMEQVETLGYAFDIEILALATKRGLTIAEMPVQLIFKRGKEHGNARIHTNDVFQIFGDTMKIYKKLR